MCGIFGQWNRDGAPVDLDLLRAATTSLRHRGPDDEGYLLVDTAAGRHILCAGDDTAAALRLPHLRGFAGQRFDLAFGFRRLSILDLSPAGHQPMAGAAGQWMVFNGEIYNFVELRSELEAAGRRFMSDTDSEVILAAYERWGEQCVERLRGMFAFAIWDPRRKGLFLARDRFGIKPLFVTVEGRQTAFASEAKALLAAGMPFRPDERAAASYIAFGELPPARIGATFFHGVGSVPAAHTLSVSGEAIQQRRYWSLPEPADGAMPLERIREEYAARFTDSIRLHLRADVPIGTCLSGGLDSSSIVAITGKLIGENAPGVIERLGAHQQTFSAVYEEEGVWNERRFIERVVGVTGAAPRYVVPTRERLLAELDALVWHQDEPFPTTSMFAQWCVMRLARDYGVRVLLDGQGADELLAGYHSFFRQHFRDLASQGNLAALWRESRQARANSGVSRGIAVKELVRQMPSAAAMTERRMKRNVAARLAASPLRDASGALSRNASGECRSLHDALASAITADPLPHLLRYEDRNGMAWSIEGRVPFLDHPLVEFAFQHGLGVRIREGWTKWLQRVTIDPLLPHDIVWRRDKVGFATPERYWLNGIGDIAAQAVGDVPDAGALLDRERVRNAEPAVAWRCLVLARWLGVFKAAAAPGIELRRDSPGGEHVSS